MGVPSFHGFIFILALSILNCRQWANAADCNICGEGNEMTNLDGIATIPDNGDFSCEILLNFAEAGQFDEATCTALQFYVESPCGCTGTDGTNETTVPTMTPTATPTSFSTPKDCYSDLDEIYYKEQALSTAELAVGRTYTICPDTSYFIARLNTSYEFVNGYIPFIPRPNVHYKCGATGSSSNNCRILDGSYAILLYPGFASDSNIFNVTFQGFSIESSAGSGVLSGLPGSITFIDCIFKNHENQGPVILQYQNQRRHLSRLPGVPESIDINMDVHRRLVTLVSQATFQHCVFEDNVVSNRGYAGMVSALSSDVVLEIESCVFRNNDYAVASIQDYSYAILALGPISMANTCFQDSYFIGGATVLLFNAVDNFEFSGNSLSLSSTGGNLTCPFVAVYEGGVGTVLTTCLEADASVCTAMVAPTMAPNSPFAVPQPTRQPVPVITMSPTLHPTARPTSSSSTSTSKKFSISGLVLFLLVGLF
eukprot:Nitzschia sp. Nitz4//scaffold297_size22919//18318//19980//NITZ4_008524-RA/size22919-exonerate_est2genome-gene-0.10-mRNA-1//1//CDS//3329546307//239//frame0